MPKSGPHLSETRPRVIKGTSSERRERSGERGNRPERQDLRKRQNLLEHQNLVAREDLLELGGEDLSLEAGHLVAGVLWFTAHLVAGVVCV